jgi:hypothetical protein
MDSRQMARMQSKLDHLETELTHLNELLIQCGFPQGIITLKEAASELIAEDTELQSPGKDLS